MDTDAIYLGLLLVAVIAGANLVGVVEGLLLGHWLKTKPGGKHEHRS